MDRSWVPESIACGAGRARAGLSKIVERGVDLSSIFDVFRHPAHGSSCRIGRAQPLRLLSTVIDRTTLDTRDTHQEDAMISRSTTLALLAICGCSAADASPRPDSDLNTLQEQLTALSERLASLEEAHAQDVAKLQDELDALNGGVDLTELAQASLAAQEAVTALDTRMVVAEAELSNLATLMTGLDEDLQVLEPSVEAHGLELAALWLQIGEIEERSEAHEASLDSLREADEAVEDELDSLAGTLGSLDALSEPLDYMSVDSSGELIISGTNLHIVSGAGSTEDDSSGLGNLIIGYNAVPSSPIMGYRDGAHNLIIGDHHSYMSYGAIVAGFENDSRAAMASVLGGSDNVASGEGATVVGGTGNLASGRAAAILGGVDNVSSFLGTAVVGGYDNIASYSGAAVVGGLENEASGAYTTVLGGRYNDATGSYSAICGGHHMDATGLVAAVLGGAWGDADWDYSAVTGGYYASTLYDYDVAP
jgi:hypothetical protein